MEAEEAEKEVFDDAAAQVDPKHRDGLEVILRILLGELGQQPVGHDLGELLYAVVIAIRRVTDLQHPTDAKRHALWRVGDKLGLSPQAMCGTDINGVHRLIADKIDELKEGQA